MTSFKPGDVLLVPYPFTDQTGSKQRPAVVISSLDYLLPDTPKIRGVLLTAS